MQLVTDYWRKRMAERKRIGFTRIGPSSEWGPKPSETEMKEKVSAEQPSQPTQRERRPPEPFEEKEKAREASPRRRKPLARKSVPKPWRDPHQSGVKELPTLIKEDAPNCFNKL